MLQINLVAGGRARTAAETLLCLDYLKRSAETGRLFGFAGFELVEFDDRKNQALEKALASSELIVCLDERGKHISSLDFSRQLANWRDTGARTLSFVIGGANGLSDAVRSRSHFTLAFGIQTWPHLLVRTMLAEQIYRAMTLLSGHPYHRV